jgi:hypothetical protein
VSVVGVDTEGRVIVSDPMIVTEGLPEDREDRAEEPPGPPDATEEAVD